MGVMFQQNKNCFSFFKISFLLNEGKIGGIETGFDKSMLAQNLDINICKSGVG